MINKGILSTNDMSCNLSFTNSSPNSPAADGRSASTTLNARVPHCTRCKNHGVRIALKGHKNYCEYWACVCVKCKRTYTRQQEMALETATRRAKKLHDEKVREYEKQKREALEKGLPPPPPELLVPMRLKAKKRPNHLVDSMLDIIVDKSDTQDSVTMSDFDSTPIELVRKPRKVSSNHLADSRPDTEKSDTRDSLSVSDSSNEPIGLLHKPMLTSMKRRRSSIFDKSLGNDSRLSSEKSDPNLVITGLQDVFHKKNIRLEIKTLLYAQWKQTPDAETILNRYIEADKELKEQNERLSYEEPERMPLYVPATCWKPNIVTATSLLSTSHPSFFTSHEHSFPYAGTAAFPPLPYHFPFLNTAAWSAALQSSPEDLFPCSANPLNKRMRLSEPEKEPTIQSSPSNLCVREAPSPRAFSPRDNFNASGAYLKFLRPLLQD